MAQLAVSNKVTVYEVFSFTEENLQNPAPWPEWVRNALTIQVRFDPEPIYTAYLETGYVDDYNGYQTERKMALIGHKLLRESGCSTVSLVTEGEFDSHYVLMSRP